MPANGPMSDWTVNEQEKSGIGSERLLEDRLRNSLHYAAEKGNLESVKLFLRPKGSGFPSASFDYKLYSCNSLSPSLNPGM